MPPMNPAPDEEQFASCLAEYDAALAQGRPPPTPSGDGASTPDIESAKECLDLLEAVWPRAAGGISASQRPAGQSRGTIHGDETLLDEPRQLGRFQLLRELGRGGGGIVFLARDPTLNRQVALKVPRLEMLFTSDLRRRFVRESETAAQLNHPNIVPVYEAGETGGICYLVSAYCQGPNLARWLRDRERTVPAHQAAQIVAALADGVAHMHSRGVLHRDIKPSNVLLEASTAASGAPESGQSELAFVPRLTDFGLAKMDAPAPGTEDVTRAGAILGTPAYMAPEQAEGRLDLIGPATDVYALGVVLYELLTGTPPFRGASDVDTLQQVATKEATLPRRLRRDVPRDVETICLKCLEKTPARRYADATALADDLRRFSDGRPITARRVGRVERSIKWMRRRPLATGMAAVTLGALVAVLALTLREPAAATDDTETLAKLANADALQWSARNVVYSHGMHKAWKLYEDKQFAQLGELLRGSVPQAGERDLRGFEWHCLWRLAQRGFVLRGHAAPLDLVAFSPDGRLCATASERERKIIVWELPQGRKIAEYPLDLPRISSLMVTADSARLVASFRPLTRPSSQSTPAGQGDSVVIKVWDLAAGIVLGEHSFPWRAMVTVSPDGRQLAGVFNPHPQASRSELQIADIGQSGRRTLLKTHQVDLHNPSFSPDGKLIAVGYGSAGGVQAHLVEATGGALVAKFEFEKAPDYANSPSFSQDGRQLAIGTFLGHGVIWDWSANKVVRFREEGNVTGLAFDPTGSVLAVRVETASGSPPYRIGLRDAGTGELLRDITPSVFHANCFALTADGQTIALCGNDNLLHLQELNPAPAEERLPPPAPSGEAWALAFSPKEPTLAVGYDNGDGQDAETLKLWDPVQKTARALVGHKGTVMAVAYSPDGATLTTASYDNRIGLWNPADGKHLAWLEGHTKPVRGVAFSPDGRYLASGGSDHTIKLWSVADRNLIGSWIAHERPIRALAFSPDGRQLASASNEECTAIWDVKTQNKLFTLADEHNVSCVAFSPDGTLLATGNERFHVKLWDPNDGKLKQTRKGHTGKLRALAFSPDGRTLATGGEDKIVRLWNVATWEELLALPTEHFINGLAFDRHCKTLAAALHDGTVKIWPADSLFGPFSQTGAAVGK